MRPARVQHLEQKPSFEQFAHRVHKRITISELHRQACKWDSRIRSGLKRLAQQNVKLLKWPTQRWLGLIPVTGRRLRREIGANSVTWWVEQDMPPYDRYRCAAYFVALQLRPSGEVVLTVRSGSQVYTVPKPLSSHLEEVLTRAVQDPPVMISRRMGPAFD